MHPSSLENMQKCFDRFIRPIRSILPDSLDVLDVGGADVNGSYRTVFASTACRYLTADVQAADGVDIVLQDPYHLPFPDHAFNVVVSGQMLEHCEYFWRAFQEMVRVLAPDGFIFLITPSQGPIHRYPVDCYRFYPDAYRALAKYAGCHLERVWRDERGPWRDLVGVFTHTPLATPEGAAAPGVGAASRSLQTQPLCPAGSPDEEHVSGMASYLDVLSQIHETLRPARYLEIGVRHGRSLALAQGQALGVDPAPDIQVALGAEAEVLAMSSDAFFDDEAATRLAQAPDLVFIDGMHLFEFALRDFMSVERYSAPLTLVLIDDIFPNHPRQAQRARETRVWTGDVWKLLLCLRQARPDLLLLPLDTNPTGTLLVLGLDAENRVLWDGYNALVRQYRDSMTQPVPDEILTRDPAVDPRSGVLEAILRVIADLSTKSCTPSAVIEAARHAIGTTAEGGTIASD